MKFYNLTNVLTQSEWLKAFKKEGFKNLKILKSNTVLEELKNSSAVDNLILPLNESLEQIIEEHYRLVLSCGNSLGYRVFRANKE